MISTRGIAALLVLGACSSAPPDAMTRGPMAAEAAPPGTPVDAAVDDALSLDAVTVLPALTVPPGALDGLHLALARAEAAAVDGRALVMVFGDSHTAGDQLTGTLRRGLGARFGFGGRGLVGPGKPPIRHYYLRDVSYGATGKWKAELGGKRDNVEPFGLTGTRVYGEDKKATTWVATCGSCPVDKVARFDVYHLRSPSSGTLSYQVDSGPWIKVATRLVGATRPEVLSIPVADGAHKLTLKPAGGGPVQLFGVALERTGPGVVVDALGVVGRRLAHLRSWDWSVIGPQVTARAPALVVLQYGTNEADDPTLDLSVLAAAYDDVIARVRAAAPTASILILGPPDMGERDAGNACDKLRPPPDADAGVPFECQWHTPAILPLVVDVQRQAAARNRVAFFDSFAAMGGGNLMDTFFHADPPLAYSDHVHFSQAGYDHWGQLVLSALLDDHARWKATAAPARSTGTP